MFILFLSTILFHTFETNAHKVSLDDVITEMKELKGFVEMLKTDLEEQKLIIKAQRQRIEYLEGLGQAVDISDMLPNTNGSIGTRIDAEEISNSQEIRRNEKIKRQEAPSGNTHSIAFYAYRSSSFGNVGNLHQLSFDVVRTNVGNGFHSNTGVFLVPESGLYVFTWSFRIYNNDYHSVQLFVNGKKEGAAYAHGYNSGGDQISATIVLQVQRGDDVFLKTGDNYNSGNIGSDAVGYTYFAGWKIN